MGLCTLFVAGCMGSVPIITRNVRQGHLLLFQRPLFCVNLSRIADKHLRMQIPRYRTERRRSNSRPDTGIVGINSQNWWSPIPTTSVSRKTLPFSYRPRAYAYVNPRIDAFWEPFARTRVNFNSVEYVRGRPNIVSMIPIIWEP